MFRISSDDEICSSHHSTLQDSVIRRVISDERQRLRRIVNPSSNALDLQDSTLNLLMLPRELLAENPCNLIKDESANVQFHRTSSSQPICPVPRTIRPIEGRHKDIGIEDDRLEFASFAFHTDRWLSGRQFGYPFLYLSEYRTSNSSSSLSKPFCCERSDP